ncbi:MAG: glycoside hydrolase, family 15 [Myxococcales bacterium]|nr:glycoside hydrolase, family 15 [Myxococcales bacterium]
MAYQPIEHYGLVGNMRTAALVGMNGSIDWYCYPNFDSPSIFGALLDDRKGGRFQISPSEANPRQKQLYWPSTNILVTRFLHPDGVLEIEDFMPLGVKSESPWLHRLCRRVRCARGAVRTDVSCRPAFDYGRADHQVQIAENGALFRAPQLTLSLSTAVPLQLDGDGGVAGEFTLEEGQSEVFIFGPAPDPDCVRCRPSAEEAEELFQTTVKFWHSWLAACTYRGRWREQVQRSALTLKLLTFEPTGALIAAPTTSLPELVGGPRNWDYRFSWLRDAAFTVYAFLRLGFRSEAVGFVQWILNYVARHPELTRPLRPLFTIYGDLPPDEQVLSHWEGYRGSSPVRIGNAAARQFQNDVTGEVMDTLYLYNKYVMPIGYDSWRRIRETLDTVCDNWKLPDNGIWEVRGGPRHFVYSKLMNWVALDRGLRLADKRSLPAERARWLSTRDEIYEEIMTQGWNPERKAFTMYYGSQELDASLLIMPLCFFTSPTDRRMVSTVEALLQSPKTGGLARDGLLYRYPPQSNVDGLGCEEGSFNMCSFWLVEALTRAGHTLPDKLVQARLLFEKILGYANHLGLYSEQIGPEGEALGNFPQAFTHLALISAAFNLDRALGGGQ